MFTSFVPALAANVAQGIDRTIRRPGGDTLPEIIKENVEARTPSLTGNVPPVLNVVGQPVKRPASQLGGANPFPVSKANSDPVVKELARLGIATIQSPTQIKLKGKASPLRTSERQLLAEAEGKLLYDRMNKWINSKGWAALDDDGRRKKIAELRKAISASRPQRLSKLRNQTFGQQINAREARRESTVE